MWSHLRTLAHRVNSLQEEGDKYWEELQVELDTRCTKIWNAKIKEMGYSNSSDVDDDTRESIDSGLQEPFGRVKLLIQEKFNTFSTNNDDYISQILRQSEPYRIDLQKKLNIQIPYMTAENAIEFADSEVPIQMVEVEEIDPLNPMGLSQEEFQQALYRIQEFDIGFADAGGIQEVFSPEYATGVAAAMMGVSVNVMSAQPTLAAGAVATDVNEMLKLISRSHLAEFEDKAIRDSITSHWTARIKGTLASDKETAHSADETLRGSGFDWPDEFKADNTPSTVLEILKDTPIRLTEVSSRVWGDLESFQRKHVKCLKDAHNSGDFETLRLMLGTSSEIEVTDSVCVIQGAESVLSALGTLRESIHE
jgi:hypothetical protein